jgi:hypothetical protein
VYAVVGRVLYLDVVNAFRWTLAVAVTLGLAAVVQLLYLVVR